MKTTTGNEFNFMVKNCDGIKLETRLNLMINDLIT